MTELLKLLWDNYYEPPLEGEKKQAIDSFISGFQLAWKLANELNTREKLRPTQPIRPSVRLDEFYYQKHKEEQHEQKEHHHNGSGHAGRGTDCRPDSQCGSGVPDGTAE